MPTRYEPELDHKPLGWGSEALGDKDTEVERLVSNLRANKARIVDAFQQCGVELQYDELPPLLLNLQLLLIKFVAKCRAHPLRTPRQLLPTVKEIRHDPQAFLDKMEDYSPEVVALVLEICLRLFPGKYDLETFELGRGTAPDIADIAHAADVAVSVLEEDAKCQKKGRPNMHLVDKLSVKLGKQFRGLGGHLRRTVHDQESGPFLSFVEAAVSPARLLVSLSGYSLNAETMVRHAREARRAKKGSMGAMPT